MSAPLLLDLVLLDPGKSIRDNTATAGFPPAPQPLGMGINFPAMYQPSRELDRIPAGLS
jgi:hypothetical protein